jgi:hypothetical protein
LCEQTSGSREQDGGDQQAKAHRKSTFETAAMIAAAGLTTQEFAVVRFRPFVQTISW